MAKILAPDPAAPVSPPCGQRGKGGGEAQAWAHVGTPKAPRGTAAQLLQHHSLIIHICGAQPCVTDMLPHAPSAIARGFV